MLANHLDTIDTMHRPLCEPIVWTDEYVDTIDDMHSLLHDTLNEQTLGYVRRRMNGHLNE
jgi:hypothetical protein